MRKFFKKLLDGIIESRERKAKEIIRNHAYWF
jgi:hypothetical protein